MNENNNVANATVVADENAVVATASVEQGMFSFTNVKGESKSYDSLEQLFRKGKKDEDAARQERKQYFGSWIAEVKDGEAIDPEALIKKIEEKKVELNHYISNLSKLKDYAEGLVARHKAEQLAASVGNMTDAEFEALKEAVANRERLVA